MYSIRLSVQVSARKKQHVPPNCSCIICNLARRTYLAVSQLLPWSSQSPLVICSGFFFSLRGWCNRNKSQTQIARADVVRKEKAGSSQETVPGVLVLNWIPTYKIYVWQHFPLERSVTVAPPVTHKHTGALHVVSTQVTQHSNRWDAEYFTLHIRCYCHIEITCNVIDS